MDQQKLLLIKKKIIKISSGFWVKPDIFHPVYNPDENRENPDIRKKKNPVQSGLIRIRVEALLLSTTFILFT
jgi:hypothetical protein